MPKIEEVTSLCSVTPSPYSEKHRSGASSVKQSLKHHAVASSQQPEMRIQDMSRPQHTGASVELPPPFSDRGSSLLECSEVLSSSKLPLLAQQLKGSSEKKLTH